MSDLLKQFVKDVNGPTNAATILCVSGAVVHKWQRETPSTLACRRIEAWFRFPDEDARFILRNVWARGEIWRPDQERYDAWLDREMTELWQRSDRAAWVSDLWKEVTT